MEPLFDGLAVKRGMSVFVGTSASVPKQSRSDPLLCISPESPLSRHLSQSIVESIEEGYASKEETSGSQTNSDAITSMLTTLSSQMEVEDADSLYADLQHLSECLESCDFTVRVHPPFHLAFLP